MNYYPCQGPPRLPMYVQQPNVQHLQQNFIRPPQPPFFDQAMSWRRPVAKNESSEQQQQQQNPNFFQSYPSAPYDRGTHQQEVFENSDVDFRPMQQQSEKNYGDSRNFFQTNAPPNIGLDTSTQSLSSPNDDSAANLAELLEVLTKYSSNYNAVVEQKIPLNEQKSPPKNTLQQISMELDDIDSPPSERDDEYPLSPSFDRYEKEKEEKFLKLETKFKLHSNTIEQTRQRIELEKLGIQIYNTYQDVDDRKGTTEIEQFDINDERKLLEQRKTIRNQLPELESRTAELDRKFKLLDEELSHLKKQHGVMCRRVQRRNCIDNDDHNVLNENANLQCEVEKKLATVVETKTNLETMIANLNKKAKQIDDLLKKLADDKKEKEKKSDRRPNERNVSPKKETRRSPPKRETRHSPPRWEIKKEVSEEKPCVYFDGGSHWCKKCNIVSASVYDFFEHLHSLKHKTNMNIFDRPWMPEHLKYPSQPTERTQSTQVLPMKGVEFLHGSSGFYCSLCREFSGDAVCAEDHLKSEKHNKIYASYVKENPYHEQCYNLEKMASLVQRIEQNNESQSSPETLSAKVEQKKFKETVFVPPMMSGCSISLSGSQQTPHLSSFSGKVEPFRLKSKEEVQKETVTGTKKSESVNPSTSQKSSFVNAINVQTNDSNMNLLRFKIAAAAAAPGQTLASSNVQRMYGPEPPKDLQPVRKDAKRRRSRSRSRSTSSSYSKSSSRRRSGSPEKRRQNYYKSQQNKATFTSSRGGSRNFHR